MITPTQLAVLRAMSETIARTAVELAQGIAPVFAWDAARELCALGLAAVDPNAFPSRWTRTETGTDLLAETKEGVAE